MDKVKKRRLEDQTIFAEIPTKSIKTQGFIKKYGGFQPCLDHKIINGLIQEFGIKAKSEPKIIEVELQGEIIKEVEYQTYYKPHTIFLMK